MATPINGLSPAASAGYPDGNAAIEHWTPAGTVRGPLSRTDTDAVVEHEQASVADSTAFGLATLASATFILSAVFTGWFRPVGIVVTIPILLIVGGIGQFLAGMWAHRRGDVLTATVFSLLGSFYAAFAVLLGVVTNRVVAAATVGSTVRGVTGIFVVFIALLTAGLGVAALWKNRLLAALVLVLALAYVLDGVGIWTQAPTWFLAVGMPTVIGMTQPGWLLVVGGYVGMVAALLACYEATALVVNSASGEERWPIFNSRPQPMAWRQAAG
jgi:uncharacterized protein